MPAGSESMWKCKLQIFFLKKNNCKTRPFQLKCFHWWKFKLDVENTLFLQYSSTQETWFLKLSLQHASNQAVLQKRICMSRNFTLWWLVGWQENFQPASLYSRKTPELLLGGKAFPNGSLETMLGDFKLLKGFSPLSALLTSVHSYCRVRKAWVRTLVNSALAKTHDGILGSEPWRIIFVSMDIPVVSIYTCIQL